MDLQTGDRAAADVAAVPAGQPGVREPGDGPGAPAPRHARLTSWGLAALAGLAALNFANSAGVVGKAAVPDLARAAAAAIVLFGVGGWGVTRLLLPPGLRAHEPLWVLPVGGCAVAVEMTVLGFAGAPFRLNLAIVLAAAVALGVLALRHRGAGPAGGGLAALRRAAWPAWLAVLLIAVALVPLFRAGFPTVEGQGQDAHLAVGSAIFLQRHYPTSVAPHEAVDRMPLVWRSKQPIYYALGATASLAGLEVFQTISTLAAVLLALSALGFYLMAREVLGAPRWVALAAMGLVGLDRMVLHTVMHPYFNQTWGFFAMGFAFVLAWWAVKERTRGGLALLALFLAVVAFAYPLALPIPLIPVVALLWPERGRLHPRHWYRGRRSLLWIVPLGIALLVPIRGVVEKALSANTVVFNPTHSLRTWGGDLTGYFPEPWFLGINEYWTAAVLALPLAGAAWLGLRELERPLRRGLLAVLVFAAVFTVWFRLREFGYYFHFKLLAFVAPVALALIAAGLGRLRPRWAGMAGVAVLLGLSLASARQEVGRTFDQLPKSVLALRQIDARLPPGASVRLDIDPQEQNWAAFMLHGQPLCSQLPLLHTSYPHVPVSRRADYIVTKHDAPPPPDAQGGPIIRLEAFTLYRAKPGLPGPDRCSQTMVQTVERVTT